jgi:hypothetical protein
VCDVAKRRSDGVVHDLFGDDEPRHDRVMPLDVRRRDVSSLPAEVIEELCAWCGVDRAGSCGACSDLRVKKR